MTAAVPDLESLGAVRPEDAMAYLASRGWRRLDEVRRMARWLQPEDGGLEVAVPLEPRFVDFAERVRDLVLGISEAEDRSPESVLRDLLNVQADAVRIQVREGAALDGSIPLDDAVNLVDGARGVLVAAASSVLEPRPRFSGGRPPLVREYLSTVRLGQTERGSFVVTLISPLATGEQVASEPAPAEPFPRRAVRTLVSALQAASSTAEDVAAGRASLEAFRAAVPAGVSVNLCESLLKVAGQDQQGFRVHFGWAPVLPAPRLATMVPFSQRGLAVLPRAMEFLRGLREDREERGQLRGSIEELRRRGPQGPGRVVVRGSFQGQPPRSVLVDVDEQTYELAIAAHRAGVPVIVSGRLTRKGRGWALLDPAGFTPLGPLFHS